MQYKVTKPIRLIEVYGGIGSQSKALKNLGVDYESWKLIEFDKFAINSYNAVHGTNYPTIDVTSVHGKDLEISDTDKYEYLMTYSFPCTSLSMAGAREGMKKGSGTASSLLWEVDRLLGETENLPNILVMENVPEVHDCKNLADFQCWLSILESLGYKNYYADLNASDYGMPQNRLRCYMVSLLNTDDEYIFPSPIKLPCTMRDMLDKEFEERYYLHNQRSKEAIESFKDINDMSDGNILYPVDVCNLAHATKKAFVRKEITTVRTLCARDYKGPRNWGDNAVIIKDNPTRIRRLTPREYWRFMGFSEEDFNKASSVTSPTQLYKQAGNSIVVNVLSAIFGQFF